MVNHQDKCHLSLPPLFFWGPNTFPHFISQDSSPPSTHNSSTSQTKPNHASLVGCAGASLSPSPPSASATADPPSTVLRPQADNFIQPTPKPKPHPFARLPGQQTCPVAVTQRLRGAPPQPSPLFCVCTPANSRRNAAKKKANKCSLKQNSIRRSMWWGGERQNRKATRRISPSPRFRSSRSSDEAQAIRPHRCWAEILSTCEGGTARLQSTLPP